MKTLFLAVITALTMTACTADESISKFADPSAEYHLLTIDGAPFEEQATIQFPEPGRVIGRAPCNSYFATQTAPYPWFGLQAIGATRMACPELEQEAAFFVALEDMALAEVAGDTLILSNSDGREMVFEKR